MKWLYLQKLNERLVFMESTTKFYSLNYTNVNTYLFAFVFIVGNVVLPQLCHLVHWGGPAMLPIYFFTLIGAYKYGFKVGMLTAVLSPLANSILFGMPSVAILPAILVKSVLLALVADIWQTVSVRLQFLHCWGLLWHIRWWVPW